VLHFFPSIWSVNHSHHAPVVSERNTTHCDTTSYRENCVTMLRSLSAWRRDDAAVQCLVTCQSLTSSTSSWMTLRTSPLYLSSSVWLRCRSANPISMSCSIGVGVAGGAEPVTGGDHGGGGVHSFSGGVQTSGGGIQFDAWGVQFEDGGTYYRQNINYIK